MHGVWVVPFDEAGGDSFWNPPADNHAKYQFLVEITPFAGETDIGNNNGAFYIEVLPYCTFEKLVFPTEVTP